MIPEEALSNPAVGPSADSTASPEAGSGQALRRRAEALAGERTGEMPENLEVLSPEAARRTLHELRVHQIELEMQNEELRRTQADLEVSRARYFDLYDLAPVGYFTLSEQGLILEANLTAAKLFGMARSALVKQPLSRFVLPEDQDIYYLHRKALLETGGGSHGARRRRGFHMARRGERHHRKQAGGGGDQDDQRRTSGIRLCAHARPSGTAAYGGELQPATGPGARRKAGRRRRQIYLLFR